mmetsp:Transcript_34690/g.44250  ORF Transcript_34690/g.44250 Transcript_34690/m.44250 type:complete len:200 (-) Transcript_34690:225-824(-)
MCLRIFRIHFQSIFKHFQKASQLGLSHPMIDSALAAQTPTGPQGMGAGGQGPTGSRPPPRWLGGRAKAAFGGGNSAGPAVPPGGAPAQGQNQEQQAAAASGATPGMYGGRAGGAQFGVAGSGFGGNSEASSPPPTENLEVNGAGTAASAQQESNTNERTAGSLGSLSGLSSGVGGQQSSTAAAESFGGRRQAGISGLRI